MGESRLPELPPKTFFWSDATARKLIAYRWGALQRYLDAVVDCREDVAALTPLLDLFLRS